MSQIWEGDLFATFSAIAETNRYNDGYLEKLSKFVTAQLGENRDKPLYKLCHFVAFLNGLSIDLCPLINNMRYASIEYFRRSLAAAIEESDRPNTQIRMSRKGILVETAGAPEAAKAYYYSMPFLAAVYEFMVTMDGGGSTAEVDNILRQISPFASNEEVANCTRKLARIMRSYRTRHLEDLAKNEKLDPIREFLLERGKELEPSAITDADLLDFWRTKSVTGKYKNYANVFEKFTSYISALHLQMALPKDHNTVIIGADVENGEVDLSIESINQSPHEEWNDPMDLFESEEFAYINFFKRSSEQKPLANLMHYGPDALRLVHSYLRLEAFEPEQESISQYLRKENHKRSTDDMLSCSTARDYVNQFHTLGIMLEHIRRLQLACAYIIGLGNEEQSVKAESVFRKLRRAGFDVDLEDDYQIDLFFRAAESLVTMANLVGRAKNRISQLCEDDTNLEDLFENDRSMFAAQFSQLYADKL